MKIKTVDVSVARKITKGFNSTEFRVGMSADLEKGDDPEEVQQELTQRCMAMIRAEFISIKGEAQEAPQAPQEAPRPLNGHQILKEPVGACYGARRA